LQNGQVLVAGGETATAELFNPSTHAFTATGSMTISRTGHTATLLPDGRVLIAGGVQDFGPGTVPIPIGPGIASAEIYDPASGSFTLTGSMSTGRSGHAAALLPDGTVLVTGTDTTGELFIPTTGTFSALGATSTGLAATATARNDGTVLVAGGRFRSSTSAATLFAPECLGFVATGPLRTARDGHTATLLLDGSVLVAGGIQRTYLCVVRGYTRICSTHATTLSSAEVFR